MCVEGLVVPVSLSEGHVLLLLVQGVLIERIDALRSRAVASYLAARDVADEVSIGEFRLEALDLIESPLARVYVHLQDVVPPIEADDPGQAAAADEGG